MHNRNSHVQSRKLFFLALTLIFGILPTQVFAHEHHPVITEAPNLDPVVSRARTPAQQQPETNGKNLWARVTRDLQCLALNIYFEARSESVRGRRAVGHVVMNRVYHNQFPNSVCDVIQQSRTRALNQCQFSWWCDGQTDRPKNNKHWSKSLQIAYEIYTGQSQDPTDGALWYHADYVKPYWSRVFVRGPKIGRHIFYLETL